MLQHPCAAIHGLVFYIVDATWLVLGFALEQRQNVLHAQLANGFAALNCSFGELSLRFLKVEDALFDGVVNGETVNGHIDGLVETMDAIDGLFLNKLCRVSELLRE